MDVFKWLSRLMFMMSLAAAFVLLTILLGFNNIIPLLAPHFVKPGLPKYGMLPSNPTYESAIQLHRNGRGFCSAVVIDANYALTAAHCVVGVFGVNKESIQIKDEFGRDTGVVAEVVASHGRIDIAMIKGDFNKFKRVEPDFYGFAPTNAPAEYMTCGFPGLQDKITCTRFVPSHNVGFSIAGKGFLIPGMSGGPVIDITHGRLIAVNSAATNGFVLVAPVLGILGAFGIE